MYKVTINILFMAYVNVIYTGCQTQKHEVESKTWIMVVHRIEIIQRVTPPPPHPHMQ